MEHTGTMNGERCIIGIDIGGTNFRIGAVSFAETGARPDTDERAAGGARPDTDERAAGAAPAETCARGGSISRRHVRKIPVGEVFCTKEPLADLTRYLKDYLAELTREGCRAEAVSIGFPATIDRERRMVMQAPNVPFMEKLPVTEALREALGIPVFIERDVSMSLLYDREKYALSGCGLLCGIYFGTGIGNAIAIDGKLLCGKNGAAGELGHIPVDGSTQRCGCGNEGCMENLAGGKYLAQLCKNVYTDTAVGDLFTKHGGEEPLRRFVERMAITAATEINILDPDCVLLGGGVPAMPDFPLEYLRERILAHVRKPYPAQGLRLIFTEDEQDKAVLGAALYARARLSEKAGDAADASDAGTVRARLSET